MHAFIRFVKNSLHLLAAYGRHTLYGSPGHGLTVIGVTGTSGKTTVVHLVYHILTSCGKNVSMISSVEARVGKKAYDTGFHVTTPTPRMLSRFLRMARAANSEYFVLEATSHGFDQGRVAAIPLSIAVITNIAHEHLDYHGTFERYRDAKAKILRAPVHVLNKDDSQYEWLSAKKGTTISYSTKKGTANVTPADIRLPKDTEGFMASNMLAAGAAALHAGIEKDCIEKALDSFRGVAGRMEEIQRVPYRIIIDFAHKPNALEEALAAVRPAAKGRVIVVFGCAGLRDRMKRPMMGEIAGRLADISVLTAEDPRTEDVRTIIGEIAGGMPKNVLEKTRGDARIVPGTQKYFFRIPDRQEAINFTIRKLAKKGDTVLLCGKGHEQSMCYGTTEYPWDEKKAVEKALHGTIKSTSRHS